MKQAPSIDQCKAWMDSYEMLDNIRAHSYLVARVAELLVDELNRVGKTPDVADKQLVIAGGLLHDIAKTLCIRTGCHHARVGREICQEIGYPHLGELVEEHVYLKNFTSELYKEGLFGAKEIVNYADKRVRHDEIVSLSERLSYILERYGHGDPAREKLIRKNFSFTTELEQFLFSFLDFSPDLLESRLQSRTF